jgi:hypothetical protein
VVWRKTSTTHYQPNAIIEKTYGEPRDYKPSCEPASIRTVS